MGHLACTAMQAASTLCAPSVQEPWQAVRLVSQFEQAQMDSLGLWLGTLKPMKVRLRCSCPDLSGGCV